MPNVLISTMCYTVYVRRMDHASCYVENDFMLLRFYPLLKSKSEKIDTVNCEPVLAATSVKDGRNEGKVIEIENLSQYIMAILEVWTLCVWLYSVLRSCTFSSRSRFRGNVQSLHVLLKILSTRITIKYICYETMNVCKEESVEWHKEKEAHFFVLLNIWVKLRTTKLQ